MVAPLLVSNPESIRLIDDVVAGDRLVGVTLQNNPDDELPRHEQLKSVGCIARVGAHAEVPGRKPCAVLIQGLKRMRLGEMVSEKPYLRRPHRAA